MKICQIGGTKGTENQARGTCPPAFLYYKQVYRKGTSMNDFVGTTT